ncbi:ATP synthase F1 subunit delta [Patescibacteria group bacterium]|nr:ATP synthase F1 subunit delta [Patescibacteria group bacterium]MBU1421267.1 ATP synthase F1 subunit delta [Patescibacteria group bacterium]MBU1684462.1 ATP synthase F1 subunit delta [Patescibacteria group bacterium]MBU2415999.1 ATP synthase F1 subunit delta [Patescibacteria group bacterium]
MKPTSKQYAQALFETIKDADTMHVQGKIKQFVKILIKHHQTSMLKEIISYFNALWNKDKKIIKAEIISARKFNETIIKLLSCYIIKLSQVSDVFISESIDKNLLGGFVIKYGDKILDASLRKQLTIINYQLSMN